MPSSQVISPHSEKILKWTIWIIILAGIGLFFLHKVNPAIWSSSAPTQAQLLDSKYLEDSYGSLAGIKCANGADDYLRSIAKWDFSWDSGDKFTSYFQQVETPGVLVMISRTAKLQNGFGAYKHITVTCDYDTQADKVIKYGQN